MVNHFSRASSVFCLPHTQLLCVGLLLGLASFILWLGLRLIVLLTGVVIVGGAITAWYFQVIKFKSNASVQTGNLLDLETFLHHLSLLDSQVPKEFWSEWQSAHACAKSIQQMACTIAEKEPAFMLDLLDALHTVLHLIKQLVQALQVSQQVQTPHYQSLAQQQLHHSQERLKQTYEQFQELYDQFAITHLEYQSPSTSVERISNWLQTIIADNKKGLDSQIPYSNP